MEGQDEFQPAVLPQEAPRVMRTPRGLDIALTARCNLRCSYCYFFDNEVVQYEDLPTEEWLRFFEECGRLGVMDLTLAGGEPFLREDLHELIQGIVENRMRFSLLSNGSQITAETASFLAATGRCSHVQVSVDGGDAEAHDAARGEGSFERAVEGIRTLQRADVNVAVRVTIHKHNVHRLEETTRFLLEDLGLPGFSTNSAGYLGSCQQHSSGLLLTVEERSEAMEALVRLERAYPNRISATAGPLAEARMWREMVDARAAGAPPIPGRGCLSGCGCHATKLAVRSDGRYIVCGLLQDDTLGRINEDALQDVWLESSTLATFRSRHRVPLRTFPECRTCEYVDYCTGNCPALALSLTGDAQRPSPDACLRRFLEQGGRIPETVVETAVRPDADRSRRTPS